MVVPVVAVVVPRLVVSVVSPVAPSLVDTKPKAPVIRANSSLHRSSRLFVESGKDGLFLFEFPFATDVVVVVVVGGGGGKTVLLLSFMFEIFFVATAIGTVSSSDAFRLVGDAFFATTSTTALAEVLVVATGIDGAGVGATSFSCTGSFFAAAFFLAGMMEGTVFEKSVGSFRKEQKRERRECALKWLYSLVLGENTPPKRITKCATHKFFQQKGQGLGVFFFSLK